MDLLSNKNSLCIALLHLLPCASIRLVRRPDQGLFVKTFGPAPRGPRCSGHVLLPRFQLARLRSAPESFRTALASGGFMKSYLTRDIRNVGIVGHGGTGKTQRVSPMPSGPLLPPAPPALPKKSKLTSSISPVIPLLSPKPKPRSSPPMPRSSP